MGSCVMKASDLMGIGFGIEVWDDDIGPDDSILTKTTLMPTQAQLLSGSITTSNGSTCQQLTVTLTRQP